MLDQRKGRILQAIVDEYVETAEPIGSEWLASRHDFGCRSATLRNEMAGMSEQGYLVQPHTSAGRIPSDLGYRYYVDRLMLPDDAGLVYDPDGVLGGARPTGEIAELVQATCRHLASMTECVCVAIPPAAQTARLHRVFLTGASPHHVLLVVLLSNGHVLHRVLEVEAAPPDHIVVQVAGCLNAVVGGCDVSTVAMGVTLSVPGGLEGGRELLRVAAQAVVNAAAGLTDDDVIVEGASYIMRQREFRDVMRLEQLLAALERRSVLADVLRQATGAGMVHVLIGQETAVEEMQACSVVATRYGAADQAGGLIGVVGPTRMRYARAVAAVEMMARSLTAVLSRASLG